MNKYLTLKEIQYEEKEMLRTFIVFLYKNNVKYYICDGTFLGAVRHKGFIPWDDDIDIAIPRPDYNKMINILLKNNHISSELEGIGFELNNDIWPFIKIINKNIFVSEKEMVNKYLWIDIFPLDGVPKKNYKWYFRMVWFKLRIFELKRCQVMNLKIKSNSNSIISLFLKHIINIFIIPINFEKMIAKFVKYCSQYDYEKSQYVRNNVWSYSYNNYIDRDNNDSILYNFEDLKVNGLKDYDFYLSLWYGKNYMVIPPENKRNTHNFKAWRVIDNESEKVKK